MSILITVLPDKEYAELDKTPTEIALYHHLKIEGSEESSDIQLIGNNSGVITDDKTYASLSSVANLLIEQVEILHKRINQLEKRK